MDEDLTRLHADLTALRNELRQMGLLTAVLESRLAAMEKDLEQIEARTERHFVPLVRYEPVEKVLYGLVALILISFVGAILSLVVIRP